MDAAALLRAVAETERSNYAEEVRVALAAFDAAVQKTLEERDVMFYLDINNHVAASILMHAHSLGFAVREVIRLRRQRWMVYPVGAEMLVPMGCGYG